VIILDWQFKTRLKIRMKRLDGSGMQWNESAFPAFAVSDEQYVVLLQI
jgi:hypothetical protein